MMLALTLRTDKPEAEIGLFQDGKKLGYTLWQAHRQLAETIQHKIKELLKQHGKNLDDVNGIIVYKGPGSFTGLRIGLSVANALAYSLSVPIVAASSETWIEAGANRLKKGESDQIALPEYGSLPHITQQKR